ncbi:uncharacterized protein BBOV_IV004205 [Babesia bovis T2Bo]|uniref:uncharacterized protein n=1 Tax=Babesia bovis T2Bo TaxID=484906 RepID=UPI001D72073E|nr:uncharacterized protein BBOV_IV004205 [Babesia bovis T2Bo]KAG6439934.1 hypothetical protein BBOV_IV004205 [Babesia bovis T2Bo]
MYSLRTKFVCGIIILMGTVHCSHTSDMVLCADMCPSSTLVSPDGVGISKCYDICKRLIHRVRYGDLLDTVKNDKVKAPKESAFRRIRQGLENIRQGKPKTDSVGP